MTPFSVKKKIHNTNRVHAYSIFNNLFAVTDEHTMQYATFIIIGQGSATTMFTQKKDLFKIYFDWLNQHLPCHVKLLVSDWIVKLCMARPFAVEKLPRGHSVTTLSVNRAVLHGCHCTRRRNVQSMEGQTLAAKYCLHQSLLWRARNQQANRNQANSMQNRQRTISSQQGFHQNCRRTN